MDNSFIITGSTTGKLMKLTGKHYTRVTSYDLDKNTVTVEGPVMASSESLTHAIIYECAGNINAVMHVHHFKLWKELLDALPSTNKHIEYGTTALAREIKGLFKKSGFSTQKIFAMGGHAEGIISFGEDLNEAGQAIFDRLGSL
jgi:ribulose-5-phosphate 4-epimerase/fuculose-1-phosphate aldolase